jgi:predicted secreted protein
MFGLNYLSLVTVLVCSSCAMADDTSRTPSSTLSPSDNGKTIRIKTGESILIELPVQLGTGYAWQPPKQEQQALFVVKQEKAPSKAPPSPGSGETQAFRLLSTQPGETEVVFQYRRSWDENSTPLKTFRIKVEAHK